MKHCCEFFSPLLVLCVILLPATVWAAEPKLLASLKEHTDAVTSVAGCPGQPLFASASRDGTVVVWDLAKCKKLQSFESSFPHAFGVGFSPDGKQLAIGGGVADLDVAAGQAKKASGGIQIRDLKSGRGRLLPVRDTSVGHVAFSPDGQSIAACTGSGLRVWELKVGRDRQLLSAKVVKRADVKRQTAGGGAVEESGDAYEDVRSIVWSSNSEAIAVGTSFGDIHVWSLPTEARKRLEHGPSVSSVCFSPDGKTLVSVSADEENLQKASTVKLWDASTGKTLATLKLSSKEGELSYLEALAFSPNGRLFATSCFELNSKERRMAWKGIHLWDMKRQKVSHSITTDDNISSLTFSSDGKYLIGGSGDGTIRVWGLFD